MRLNEFDRDEGFTIESLMEALFYRDEFLSIASHELKTPLTTLKLHTQVFKRGVERHDESAYSKEKIDRLINQIEKQATKLSQLVDDMLDISRIRSGKLVMVKEKFSLSELAHVCVRKTLPLLSHDNLMKSSIADDIDFTGDEARIGQVILNILNNAARYGKGKPIELKLERKKNKIVLSVKDYGRGIHPDDQKRIFHRFQRAIPASEVSGLGLGLYIAKEIVEAHDGKISVKSELDKGSVFKVEFKQEEV